MPHRFRIATYNIHKGRGIDGRVRVERILHVLRDIDADIIALQEVVVNPHGRSIQAHQARYLAEELGHSYHFAETRLHRLGWFGNMTLSRWPIRSAHQIDLSVAGRHPRGALRTDIQVDQMLLHVFNVHLGTAMRERHAQAKLIDERLLKVLDISGHRVVLGDFNDWNHGLVTQTLRQEFNLTDLAQHLPRTRAYPAILPLLHLDHIYLDHHLRIENARFHRTRRSLIASDHLPLVVDVVAVSGGKH
jgi:endonuclease/exonuclease/phosphatase family metal-dependent hydrolase